MIGAAPVRILMVSDTHIRGGRPTLPHRLVELLRDADLVLHAGDVVDEAALARFRAARGEVVAVSGNMDARSLVSVLPERRRVETPGGTIALMHILPRIAGGPRQVVEHLLDGCDRPLAVVYGHSHRPELTRVGLDGGRAAWIINPGSPTRSRGWGHSCALMTLDDAEPGKADAELISLD